MVDFPKFGHIYHYVHVCTYAQMFILIIYVDHPVIPLISDAPPPSKVIIDDDSPSPSVRHVTEEARTQNQEAS